MKTWTRFLLTLFWLGQAQAQQQPPLVPYAPNVFQDKKGNEWFIEQNGGLQRNGSQPSIISGGMTLHVGNQQFYSQQPMMTQDGREMTMTSPQPVNGLNVTRRISVLDRDGALRYVEEFANTSGRDLTFSVEIRHGFNNPSKIVLSDAGRTVKDALESGESGLLVTPNQEDRAPSVLLTLCAPGATAPPRITIRNGYQVSVFYSLTIPAGQSAVVIHAIAQAKVPLASKPEEIAKAFQPFHMRHLTKGLPRPLIKAAVNLASQTFGVGLEEWFPATFWGISPEASDLLVLDDASRLKGRAAPTPAEISTPFGKASLDWEKVAAIAGPAFTQTKESWVWLRDGQRWKGVLEPQGVKFALTAGAELNLPRPNRLILRRPLETDPDALAETALLETWTGERLAFLAEGRLAVQTPWGEWDLPWAEVLALAPAEGNALGGLLHLRDGSRLRVLPAPVRITLQTKDFGPQEFDLAKLKRAVTPQAAGAAASDEREPVLSFVELAGDQRLVCRVTSEKLRFLTQSGPVELAPASIREMRLSDEAGAAGGLNQPPRFEAELWGAGSLTGVLENSSLAVEGSGFTWRLPIPHLTRLVNPVPVADNALMRRTGELIRTLGDADWKNRERATTELREMGLLAKASLQEALKGAADAEVIRRIETLLSEME